MTNIVDRTALVAALTSLCRVADKRATIPILSHVIVEADRHRGFNIRATNLDIDLTVRVRDVEVLNNATFTVEADNLLNMMKRAKSDKVLIDPVDPSTNTVQWRMNTLMLKLHMLPAADFPPAVTITEEHAFDISTDDLLAGLTRCAPSVSTEETRYYLNGVYWHVPELGRGRREMRFVATDGHRLAKQVMSIPKGAEKMPAMILPRQLVHELIRVCAAKEAPSTIKVFVGYMQEQDVSYKRVIFQIGDHRYASKLIDGTFPDYDRVIPTGNDKTLKIDREKAIDAIKVVTAIRARGDQHTVRLTLNGTTTFSCKDPDRGVAQQVVEGALQDPTSRTPFLDIGFNARYLISIFEQMASDTVELKLADPGSPTLFSGKDDPGALHVLMPMRV